MKQVRHRVAGCWAALSLVAAGLCAFGQRPPGTQPSAAAGELRRAISTAEHGDAAAALALTQTLLAEHPDYAPALKFKGSLEEDAGDQTQANADYEHALRLAPEDSELMLKVGIGRLVAGRLDEAAALLNRRVEAEPRDSEALYYLAQSLHLQGHTDLALATIRRAVAVEPGNAPARQKLGELLCSAGDNEAAVRELEAAQHADATLPRIDFDLGVAYFQSGNFEGAQPYAQKAVQARPNDLKALALLAAAETKLEHWDTAKPLYERILSVHGDDTASLLGLGHCELALQQDAAAVSPLEHLVQLDPTEVLGHFYLSRAYADLGKTEQAEHEAALHTKLLEQSVSVAPREGRDVEEETMQEARALLTAKREPEALKLFAERVRGPNATAGTPWLLTGVAYLQLGQAEDAQRALRKALEVQPSVRGAYTYLGILALRQGDLVLAEKNLRAELAAAPHYDLALAELGEVSYRQQQWELAADRIASSKTVVPYLLYMLCDAQFHLGRASDAEVTAELLVAYNKDDQDLRQQVIALLKRNTQEDAANKLAHPR